AGVVTARRVTGPAADAGTVGARAQARTAPPPLWTGRQLIRLLGLQAVAATLLVLAWLNASDRLRLEQQLGALNLGAAGVVVAGLANAAWLVAGRRRVNDAIVELTSAPPPAQPAPAAPPVAGTWVTVPGTGRRRHRPDCPLVAGKATGPAPTAAPVCGVCGRE
ncbi:MAG TPA: hypothetical protein VHL53_12640, partial [Acidimicrobiia bacterium]|nr:hypothetical protein [Acidimicrobiia bacterium]